jgi:hypothetical protein
MRPTAKATIVQNRLPDLLLRLRPGLQVVLNKAAQDVEARAKVSILSDGKSGRMYGPHQASAPGEAPANDLGNLAAGIAVADGADALHKRVVSNAEYSEGLELGTTKVAARPFLGPALESVRQPFTRAVQQVVDRG